MALGKLNLRVKKQDFVDRIEMCNAKMDVLSDVIEKYRQAKVNLDQFVQGEDDSYQRWVERIDAHIDAAGRAKASLAEAKKALEETVNQMDDFGSEVEKTVSDSVEALKSTAQAAINIAPLL